MPRKFKPGDRIIKTRNPLGGLILTVTKHGGLGTSFYGKKDDGEEMWLMEDTYFEKLYEQSEFFEHEGLPEDYFCRRWDDGGTGLLPVRRLSTSPEMATIEGWYDYHNERILECEQENIRWLDAHKGRIESQKKKQESMPYKTDRMTFESKEICDAWYKALTEITEAVKPGRDGLYTCPHCDGHSVGMPGYLYFHFKQDKEAFEWLLGIAKKKLANLNQEQ